MRVAWVLYGDLAQRTGGTIYDAKVVDGLRAAGDDVRVVSLEQDVPPELPRGFRLTLPRIAPLTPIVQRALALAREVRAFDADVVVGDELCFRELAVAFRKLRGGRPARVLLVHHLTAWETERGVLPRQAARLVERLALSASDRIVATSSTTRDRLVAEKVKAPVDVVLPGADRLSLERKHTRAVGVRFVSVGTVVARKRVVELVRAFAKGASTHARLAIVGSTTRDAGYVREVRRAIAQHHLVEHVTMLGELGEEGVAQALAEADALVMPSSLEGYGIAATEAIRAGIPVIAARAQGLEEALAPCPAARLFADDEAALAAALARFATDASLRATMTTAAGAAASRMPTWAACIEGFRASLARALAR